MERSEASSSAVNLRKQRMEPKKLQKRGNKWEKKLEGRSTSFP